MKSSFLNFQDSYFFDNIFCETLKKIYLLKLNKIDQVRANYILKIILIFHVSIKNIFQPEDKVIK